MQEDSGQDFAAMRQHRIDQIAKLRHTVSSPKLREMLKEKCRIRMKESRRRIQDDRRHLVMDNKSLIAKMLQEEMVELDMDIEEQESIFKEIIDNVDQWLFEDMETMEQEQIDKLDEGSDIFCPVCLKYTLVHSTPAIITCHCGLRVAFSPGVQILHGNILRVIKLHDKNCTQKLIFFAEPSGNVTNDFSSLNAYCQGCDFFHVLIV